MKIWKSKGEYSRQFSPCAKYLLKPCWGVQATWNPLWFCQLRMAGFSIGLCIIPKLRAITLLGISFPSNSKAWRISCYISCCLLLLLILLKKPVFQALWESYPLLISQSLGLRCSLSCGGCWISQHLGIRIIELSAFHYISRSKAFKRLCHSFLNSPGKKGNTQMMHPSDPIHSFFTKTPKSASLLKPSGRVAKS